MYVEKKPIYQIDTDVYGCAAFVLQGTIGRLKNDNTVTSKRCVVLYMVYKGLRYRERKIRDSEIHKRADGILSRTENGKYRIEYIYC